MAEPLKQGSYVRNFTGASSNDTGIFPRFYMEAELDQAASAQAGREIWRDVEMVEMLMPGNMLTRPTAKVSDEHRQRWPQAYEAFRRQEEYKPDGRPLEEWPMLTKAQIRELKSLEFHTVEQLAEMSEVAINRIGMGARALKGAAQAFLADTKEVLPIKELIRENNQLKGQLEAQALQISQMAQQLEQLNGRFLEMASRPSAVASHIPASADPMQAGLYAGAAAAVPAAGGSLAQLEKRLAGRKPRAAAEPEVQQSAETAAAPRKRTKKTAPA